MESVKCVECGNIEPLKNWQESFVKKLIEMQCCHACEYWMERITATQSQVVVDGVCYQIDNNRQSNNKHKGHGGKVFKIEFLNGRVIETDNLWYNGIVPERFRDRIPNNATFLTT